MGEARWVVWLALVAACGGNQPGGDDDGELDGGRFPDAVSAPDAPAGATVIGPEGGMVSVPGARLFVPQGALSQPTAIWIQALTFGGDDEDGDPITPVFQFHPEGLTFDVPAEVELDVPTDPPPSPYHVITYWTAPGSDEYGVHPSALIVASDDAAHVFSRTTHFSKGFVGALGDFFLTGLAALACRVPPQMGMADEPCCAGRCFGPTLAGANLECVVDEESITDDRCIQTGTCGVEGYACCATGPACDSFLEFDVACSDDLCCAVDSCSDGEETCLVTPGTFPEGAPHICRVGGGHLCGSDVISVYEWVPMTSTECEASDLLCCPDP